MRLTNEIRDDIMAAALRAAFDKRQKAHDLATKELGDAVYAHEYGTAAKIAAKLPDGWCETSSAINIQSPGFHYRNPEMKRDQVFMSKSRRIRLHQASYPVKINPDHPLWDQAQAVANEFKALRNDRAELEAQLKGIVRNVTTVPKLLEVWPDAKRYLPKLEPKTTAIVPAGLVAEVNAKLGIAG